MEYSERKETLPSYRYQALEGRRWIRVLQLQAAADFRADLVCRIIHLDRDWLASSTDPTLNSYNAVSYAWGERQFTSILQCAQSNYQNSYIKITPNVEAMLRRFRKVHKSINLWLDAVCLNQADEVEIQQQLSQIGSIFAKSLKTRVWLGEEDGDIAGVFAFIKMAAHVALRAHHGPLPGDITWPDIVDRTLRDNGKTEKVTRLFHRSWFSRRWVLQEYQLSRIVTFYCNGQSIHGPTLLSAMRKLFDPFEFPAGIPGDDATNQALHLLAPLDRSNTLLLQILWYYHHTACSDPRDRLFALSGLCSRRDAALFDINYHQSPWVIYKLFAAEMIMSDQLPELLFHTSAFGSAHGQDPTTPSWVPNWTVARTDDPERSTFDNQRWLRLVPTELGWPTKMEPASDAQYDIDKSLQYIRTTQELFDSKRRLALVSEDNNLIRTIQQTVTVQGIIWTDKFPSSWSEIIADLRATLRPHGFALDDISELAKTFQQLFKLSTVWQKQYSEYHSSLRRNLLTMLSEIETGAVSNQAEIVELEVTSLAAWREMTNTRTLFYTQLFVDQETVSGGGSSEFCFDKLLIGFGPKCLEVGDFVIVPSVPDWNFGDMDIPQGYGHLFRTAPTHKAHEPPVNMWLESLWHDTRIFTGSCLGNVTIGTLRSNERRLVAQVSPSERWYYRSEQHGEFRYTEGSSWYLVEDDQPLRRRVQPRLTLVSDVVIL